MISEREWLDLLQAATLAYRVLERLERDSRVANVDVEVARQRLHDALTALDVPMSARCDCEVCARHRVPR